MAAGIVDREIERGPLSLMRAEARARRRPPRKAPEYRPLDRIMAECHARGQIPVVLGPSGILEIRDRGVTALRAPIGIEPARRPESLDSRPVTIQVDSGEGPCPCGSGVYVGMCPQCGRDLGRIF